LTFVDWSYLVSAFYFETADRLASFEGFNHGKGKLLGYCIKVTQEGFGTIQLPQFGEKYLLTFPTVYISK
jgi:hypothetical protein